jgi:hypothetical protein
MSDSTTAYYHGIMIEDEDGSTDPMAGLTGKFITSFVNALDFDEEQLAGIFIYHRKGTFAIKLPKQDSLMGLVGGAYRVDFLRAVMKAIDATDNLGIADSEIEIWGAE